MDPMAQRQVVAVDFFDTTIDVKKYSCSLNGDMGMKIQPYVNLYINVNDVCQADCDFCEFHKGTNRKFDFKKLYETVKELKYRGIAINKVNFSGGEPMIHPEIIERCLHIIPDDVYIELSLT